MAAGPMTGITVLDLGTMIAGPMAATMLADQGADVIKIEAPGSGDVLRYLGATRNGLSAMFHNVNRGKRSVALNLKSTTGLELLKELLADADVLVENFRPGVTRRLGVDYETLRQIKPELIYLSVCGFGDRGPDAEKPAYDNVIQAFAGVAHSQLDRNTGEPAFYQQLFCDKVTALTGSQAIASALYAREKGAGGQHIRLSMVDSVLNFLWADVAGVDAFHEDGAMEGLSVAKGIRMLRFSDGFGTASPVTDSQFAAWANVFGVDVSDPRLATVQGRNQNSELLAAVSRAVEERALERSVDEVMSALEAEAVPCARVNLLADLPAHPQIQANESFAEVEHPRAGRMREPNHPPNFSATPVSGLRPCPALGQHTDSILQQLKKTPTQIAALREANIIG